MTISKQFHSDPKVKEAKKLIKEALKSHQEKITGLMPSSDPKSYQELIKKLSENRGGKLFYDYIGSGFGKGPFVELADGSTKYDFITGIGVHYFGHSHPGLMESLIDGAISNTVMQGNLQQNTDSEKLIDLLLTQANIYGADLSHVVLTSSGVMAVENALKMAFQKNHPADRVLAFNKCFHGRTIAVAGITDKAKYRDGLPEAFCVDYLPFYDEKDHKGSLDRMECALAGYITRYPGKHAAILCEVIQGEAGSWLGNTEYFEKLFTICRENNISIIIDEVQSFGRTEKLFAFQYFGLDKYVDFVTIGKNSQTCATIYRGNHKPRPGLISQTFTSSSTAINASYFVINSLINDGYLGPDGKINKIHSYFSKKLEELHKAHPDKIEGPWGIGAMVAMTLFKGDAAKSKDFTFKLFKNGVLSFIAGQHPTRVRFLVPAGAIENHHIDEVCKIIDKTLGEF